jgi:hypothetical protein
VPLSRRVQLTGSGSGSACGQPEWAGKALYPSLWEWLFASQWPDDGSARETGTVLLFVEGGQLKAMFNDRAQSLLAFMTLGSSGDVLGDLEAALAGGRMDWRSPRPKTGGRK